MTNETRLLSEKPMREENAMDVEFLCRWDGVTISRHDRANAVL